MDNSIENIFLNKIKKIEESPIHPFIQNGIIHFDDDDNYKLDGDVIEEVDKELGIYFGKERASILKNNKITDITDIQPIMRMEKEVVSENLCRENEIVVNDSDPLSNQIIQLMQLMELSQAPGTKRVQNYSWRSWVGWLEDKKSKHPELETVDRFHPGKYVLGLYLLQMRVVYGYSHSTVVNCFWNQLCVLLKDERNIDLKMEMGEFMRKLFRSLIRKYGKSKFKVCPLLNKDLQRWQKKLVKYDNREPQIKLRALIMYGRYLGWRGDTISYMRLRNLVFSTIVLDDGSKLLAVKSTGYKDKGIGREELQNTIYGGSDWNDCPVFALLWYLFHIRKVFSEQSLQELIDNKKYEYKDDCQDEYLFTQSTSEQPMSSKDMSNLMKASSHSELNCRYTMRSLRSGNICQALMTSILRYGIIKDHIRQAVKRHVGWNNDESIDAYERMSIFCSQNIASLQDLQQNTEAQNVVRSYLNQHVVMSSTSSNQCPVRMVMREVRRSSKRPKKSPASVVKHVSFRKVKDRILELRPKLKIACDEEDKRAKIHGEKQHQAVWMAYHQPFIKKWAEKSKKCRVELDNDPIFVHGSKIKKNSILLNVGKRMFLKLATGDKLDYYINKIFTDDYQPKSDTASTTIQKLSIARGVKRRLNFSDESDEDTLENPILDPFLLPELEGLITQVEDPGKSETEPQPTNTNQSLIDSNAMVDENVVDNKEEVTEKDDEEAMVTDHDIMNSGFIYDSEIDGIIEQADASPSLEELLKYEYD